MCHTSESRECTCDSLRKFQFISSGESHSSQICAHGTQIAVRQTTVPHIQSSVPHNTVPHIDNILVLLHRCSDLLRFPKIQVVVPYFDCISALTFRCGTARAVHMTAFARQLQKLTVWHFERSRRASWYAMHRDAWSRCFMARLAVLVWLQVACELRATSHRRPLMERTPTAHPHQTTPPFPAPPPPSDWGRWKRPVSHECLSTSAPPLEIEIGRDAPQHQLSNRDDNGISTTHGLEWSSHQFPKRLHGRHVSNRAWHREAIILLVGLLIRL